MKWNCYGIAWQEYIFLISSKNSFDITEGSHWTPWTFKKFIFLIGNIFILSVFARCYVLEYLSLCCDFIGLQNCVQLRLSYCVRVLLSKIYHKMLHVPEIKVINFFFVLNSGPLNGLKINEVFKAKWCFWYFEAVV